MKQIVLLLLVSFISFTLSSILYAESLIARLPNEKPRIILKVIDHDDPKNGIESKICICDVNEKVTVYRHTDENGRFEGDIICKSGEKVKIDPISSIYYPSYIKCPVKITSTTIRLTKVYRMTNLEANAVFLESAGRYGDAALVFNEICARAIKFDEKKATKAATKTFELTGKIFNVEPAIKWDTLQKKEVLTNIFVDAIKDFQRSKTLNDTGKLDYGTLRAVSNSDIGVFIFYPPYSPSNVKAKM